MPLTDIWETLADAGLTGRFVGAEERLKAPARVDAKIREDARVKGSHPPDAALAAVTDAVRYTLVYPDDGYAVGLQADAERLAALGCELIDRTAGPAPSSAGTPGPGRTSADVPAPPDGARTTGAL